MASLTSRLAGWAAGRLKGEKAREKTMEFVDKTGVGKLLSLAGDAAILGGAGKLAGMGARAIGAKLGMGGAGQAAQAAEIARASTAAPVPGVSSPRALMEARMSGALIPGLEPKASALIDAGRGVGAGVTRMDMSDVAGAARRGVTGLPANIRLGPVTAGTSRYGMDMSGLADAARRGVMGVPESAQMALPRMGIGEMMRTRGAQAMEGLRGAGRYLRDRPEIVGQALTAGATARTGAANRQLERERMAQQESQFRREFGQSEGERQREIDRQRRIAEMLAPLFQRVAGGQG